MLVADAHTGLAGVLSADGRFDEALDHARAAVRAQEDTYGAEHPYFAVYLNNLASMQLDAGRMDDAFATALRVLAILEGGLERGDFSAASGRLGLALHTMGEILNFARGARTRRPSISRARAIVPRDGRAGGLRRDSADIELAEAFRILGRVADAQDKLDEAEALEEKVKGIPATTVADTLAVRAKISGLHSREADRRPPVRR